MKILWFTPIVLPKLATDMGISNAGSGGWLGALLPDLECSEDVSEIHIVSFGRIKRSYSLKIGKVHYYYLFDHNSTFGDSKKIIPFIEDKINEIRPDIIDIQGLEFQYAKYITSFKDEYAIAGTIQGLTSQIYKYMTAGISLWELIKNRTLKDFILFDGILERKRKYYKRGRSEIKAIKNLDYVLGRTFWDFSQVKSLNPSVNYYSCERSLRREFFDKSWNIDNVKAFSIFVSQCHTPFKGLHILLKAVYILKKDYPDIRVNIAGIDITSTKSLIEKLKIGTYGKFLTSLIKNLKLTENIKFLGTLNAEGMAQNLSDSHCFVMPSFIENSPNSLAEAMLVGTPSIASFVGGAPEVIKHGENGYLYNPYEPESLAYYIDKVFSSDELSSSLSINGRLESRGKHVSDGNANNLLKAYKEIIVDYEEK